MRNLSIISILFFMLCLQIKASDVQITNAVFQDKNFGKPDATITATLTVSWKNAWRNKKNYDTVWLFFKLKKENETRSQRHGILKKDSFRLIHNYLNNNVNPAFWMPEDAVGVMIFPDKEFRGDVSWRIQADLDVPKIKNLANEGLTYTYAHAVEMVFIPQGAFYAGDPSNKNSAAFYEYGTNNHFRVTSENAITVGTQNGNLFYDNQNQPDYKGDAKGVIPAEFPKGFEAFYLMKYELTQGLYTDFLNSISAYWTTNRANFGGKFYTKQRGSIYLEDSVYKTTSRHRPASFLSFEDSAAWTDWAGLRPMTELEFEKASRGTNKPVAKDFPWGTDSNAKLSRYFNDNGDFVWQTPLDEKDLNDNNLELFGASFYWVMDLNKGLWERCVTVGNERGRQFKGSHGDGVLLDGYFGVASNEDWANGVDGKGGISYRGGGFYINGMVGSPIGTVGERDFGAWGDGPRDIAYGYRAARSFKP
jgi:formylglycine-generating enzyme required for sulfatase activity